MKRLCTILATALLLAADKPPTAQEKADIAALQGFWVLKTSKHLEETEQMDPTEDELEPLIRYRAILAEERELPVDRREQRTTLEIKANTFESRFWVEPIRGGKPYVWSTKGTYTVDVTRTPKLMIRKWAGEAGAGVGYYAYRVQGDTLQLLISLAEDPKKLPTTFAVGKDEDLVLLTYKREKK